MLKKAAEERGIELVLTAAVQRVLRSLSSQDLVERWEARQGQKKVESLDGCI